jgi:hypothetical protein
MSEIEITEIKEAWDRIARSADGQTAYRHLQGICMRIAAQSDVSALPFLEGRRSLAYDLMAYMAEGITDSDRYAVTFVTRVAARDERARGAGRRINADTFIPGYDSDTTGDAGSGSNGSGGGTS